MREKLIEGRWWAYGGFVDQDVQLRKMKSFRIDLLSCLGTVCIGGFFRSSIPPVVTVVRQQQQYSVPQSKAHRMTRVACWT